MTLNPLSTTTMDVVKKTVEDKSFIPKQDRTAIVRMKTWRPNH